MGWGIHYWIGRFYSRFGEQIELIGVVRGDPLCHPLLRSTERQGHESLVVLARDRFKQLL
jgi:hypothetical protein